MMPITPIGTRMRATSMPVGRRTRSESEPTGSASPATCSTPSAICSTLFAFMRQPVDEGGVAAGLLRLPGIGGVRRQDVLGARADLRRHRAERAVFRSGIGARELARGGARAPTQLSHVGFHLHGGHSNG